MTDLVHRYAPRGAARAVLSCAADKVLLAGPAGTGKSRACLEKLHIAMVRNPGARGLIVRKTAVSLTNTALVTFDQHVIAKALKMGVVTWYGGSQREPAQYRYANGSSINVGGMDKPEKVMSSEYDMIYVQEATELSVGDWEALDTRLRNGRMRYQQLLADCNPSYPTHFLKQAADAGTIQMMRSVHEDNPKLYDDQGMPTAAGVAYMKRLDALTGTRYQRLRHGRWVAAEGAIYEDWDTTVHLVDALPVEAATWRRFWSIDWGYTHPFVCQRWAEDPDGRLWLYAETYRTGRTVDQHVDEIMNEVAPGGVWREPKPTRVVADTAGAGERAMFTKLTGIHTTGANKDVLNGIQAMQRRLRIEGDGRPRLFIVRDACKHRDQEQLDKGAPTCTADEMPGYTWATNGKEEPIKQDDDGCDAARYIVADRDLRPTYRIRTMTL